MSISNFPAPIKRVLMYGIKAIPGLPYNSD